MIYPKFIKPGDSIGVTALSSGNGDERPLRRLESAISTLEEKGYRIIETPNVRKEERGRSSPKEIRAKEFMELIKNDDVNAIVCARGGEFLIEVLPFLNFDEIKENPKWVQGYSDGTIIDFCITTICDTATLYGYNFGAFGKKPWHKSVDNCLKLLEGNCLVQESFDKYQKGWAEEITGLEPFELNEISEWKNAKGEGELCIEGRIIGGCIDSILEVYGTKYDNAVNFCEKYKEDGIIWYFDNCELSSEDMFRALWKFKEGGWFKYCKGVLFGRSMTRKSIVGISFEEAVMHILEDLNLPIIFDIDMGHEPPRFTIVNGAIAKVLNRDGKGTIEFTLK